MPNLDAAAAFRAKIFEILVGQGTDNRSFLSFVAGGQPVLPQMLNFLDEEDVSSAENFALWANNVPAGVGDWVASGSRIWSHYSDWIKTYDPPPYHPSEEDKTKLEEAMAYLKANYAEYRKYRSAFRNTQLAYEGWKYMSKDLRPKDYTSQLGKTKIAMEEAKSDWEILGNRLQYEEAEAHMSELGRKDPALTRKYLTDTLGEPVFAGSAPFYPTSLYPQKFTTADVQWTRFTMTSSEISEYENKRNVQFGGTGSVEAFGFLTVEGKVEGEYDTVEMQLDTSGMTVEFDLIRVAIQRPWFDPFLLYSHAWKWPQQTVENPDTTNMFSNGQMPPSGRMVMVPQDAIFARNIRVKLNKSSTYNKDYLLKVEGDVTVGLGPLKISGSIKWKDEEHKVDKKVYEDGFEVSTMQIIAFLCNVVPKCPDPDWSYWKTPTEPLAAAV